MSCAVALLASQARLTVPIPRGATPSVARASRTLQDQRRSLQGSPTPSAHKARAHCRRGPRPAQASADFASQGTAADKYRPLEDEVLDEDVEETWAERGNRYFHVSVGAASLLLLNEAITRLFAARAITFSPPLAGMLLSITALCVAKACGQSASNAVDNLMDFYEPLRNWVARWMPVFFVPSLIVLPRAAADIAQGEMVRMVGVTMVGWVASIAFAVMLVRLIRAGVHSDITPDEEYDTSPHPVNPFSKRHYLFWGFINLLPLALAPAVRSNFWLFGSMFLFASTIKGYLYGVALPRPLKRVVHPLIMCCLYSSGCAALWAYLTNLPYLDVLELYMPTGAGAIGPGSMLMAMLAVVVLCDGQRVFLQRRIVKHHAVEIFGTIIASALFSLFATAYIASFAGLEPMLAKSILPRAVTVALALPMTEVLGGSPSVTASLVCITGLIGAAFGQLVLTTFRVRDEISRGVAQGATSHGLGASALAANEPQALPFSAVTIAIMGSVSNLLLYVPFVRSALLAICG